MEDIEPITQEIEDQKEKWISRISLWVSIVLTTLVVFWYYKNNPPDSPAVVKMRVFFKENNRDVMTFIDLPRNEMIAFAYKKKHPFYVKFVKAQSVRLPLAYVLLKALVMSLLLNKPVNFTVSTLC